MGSDGNSILSAVNQLRSFFEDIGKLLQTCDGMMEEVGWKQRLRNTCITEMSWSIQQPRQWMPHTVFRFFLREDRPHLLVAASVILGDIYLEDKTRLAEPLVSGIVYDYGRGNKIQEDWSQDYAGWHIWIKGAKDDGSVKIVDPRIEWPKDKVTAIRVASFAVPLVSITDSEALKHKVALPLDVMARQLGSENP